MKSRYGQGTATVAAELRALVALGESQNLEFKRQLPRAERLARTLTAFANTDGGTLLVGISDDGRAIGCDVDEAAFRAAVDEACTVQAEPAVTCTVRWQWWQPGCPIGRVDVPASLLAPHRLYFAAAGQDLYVRVGSSDRLADASQVRRPTRSLPVTLHRWQRVEAYLRARGRLTQSEYMRLVNTSRQTARAELHRLVQSGHLRLLTAGGQEEYTL